MDERFEFFLADGGETFYRRKAVKQNGGYKIHAFIRALGGKNRRDEQLPRRAKEQGAMRVGIKLGKSPEQPSRPLLPVHGFARFLAFSFAWAANGEVAYLVSMSW